MLFRSYQPGVPRTVRVLRPNQIAQVLDARDRDKVVWVPFVGPTPVALASADERLFLLRIAGDAMTEAGIRPGDWVVVRRPDEQLRAGNLVGVLHPV